MGSEPGKLTSKHLDKNHIFQNNNFSERDLSSKQKNFQTKKSLPLPLTSSQSNKNINFKKDHKTNNPQEIQEIINFIDEYNFLKQYYNV